MSASIQTPSTTHSTPHWLTPWRENLALVLLLCPLALRVLLLPRRFGFRIRLTRQLLEERLRLPTGVERPGIGRPRIGTP